MATLAGRIRTVIDGMMIAGAVFLCSWVVVLDQVYAAGDGGLFATTISLAYPLGDVVLITIALYVLLRGRARRHQSFPMWMIVFGLSAFAVATAPLPTSAPPVPPGSGCHRLVRLFRGDHAGTLRPPPLVPDSRSSPRTRGLSGSCPVAVGLALVTSSIEIVHTGQTDKVVSWCRMFIIAAMVVRQVLTLSNRSLTRHLEERLVELRGSEQRFNRSSSTPRCRHRDRRRRHRALPVGVDRPCVRLPGRRGLREVDQDAARRGERTSTRARGARDRRRIVWVRVLDLQICKPLATCAGRDDDDKPAQQPSVRGIVLNTRDVSERKMLEDQLVYSAFHDLATTPRTGAVPRSRRGHLETAGRRHRGPLPRLDSFKQVNDLLGHASGDLLLVQVAERLRFGSIGRHRGPARRRRVRRPARGRG